MHAKFIALWIGATLLSVTLGATLQWIRWEGVTEVAVGRGEKGPWRQNASRYDYVDDPTVAIDAAGVIAVAWVDQKNKDVFFQKFSSDGVRQGASINVSKNPATFSWLPRIVTKPNDPEKIYLLWQEIIFSGGSHGGDILFARSSDGGASFSAPLNLSNSPGGDGKGRIDRDTWSNGSLDLAIGANGALYAAWTEYDGALWLARSSDGGKRFSGPQKVAGNGGQPARGPSLAIGPTQVYLSWAVGEDPAARIRVAQSLDGGATFSEPHIVGSGAGHADAPRLALDAGGTLHLVYAESAAGLSGRYQIRYAQSTGGPGKFGVPRLIHTPATEGAAYPSLAVDGKGGLCVMWDVFPGSAPEPRGMRLAFSADGGNSFDEPALVPASIDRAGGTNGSHQGLLMNKLALHRSGTIAIVGSSMKKNDHSRVWLVRAQLAR